MPLGSSQAASRPERDQAPAPASGGRRPRPGGGAGLHPSPVTSKSAFPCASGRRAPSPRFTGVWAMWLLVTLCVLPIVLPWTGAAMAGTRIAMSRSPPPDPVKLGTPALSPDGKLAAVDVTFDEFLPRLVVFDIDREELVVVDRPDNEGWLSPTFSSSGDRIAFIRYCAAECAVGTQGFQLSILDRTSGATTTVTGGRDLYRGSPHFAPDGQSVVYGSRDLVWKGDFLARGFGWRHRLPHSGAGGGPFGWST